MNKIYNAFKNKKAFIPFITGGDPTLDVTQKLVLALQEAGADLIEIGIPFSDPIAEGMEIQEADARALKGGCTTDKLFDTIKEIKDQVHVPMVFMTYLNVIYSYGKERFMKRCVECGMAGVIVPDMPLEEKEEISGECRKYGVELISFLAPAAKERMAKIAEQAEGFLYCMAASGASGVEKSTAMIEQICKNSNVPCAVGIDAADPEKVRKAASVFDGVIAETEIVKIVARYGEECISYVSEYVRKMGEAVRAV